MKVHLIDATFELFRAFFGAPRKNNAGGREVGAAVGLLRTLVVLLRGPEVTHLACAFDHVIESFRNELFPGYKTSEGVDPELLAQFDLAEQVSSALGIVTWPMVEFEADDALATAAARYNRDARVEQVVICSPDKDFAQCVIGDRVVCWDRMRQRILGEAGVKEKFGVGPASIPDLLALTGDAADGIPGIPRWGRKSAGTLLSRYGSITEILRRAGSWEVSVRGAEALWQSLRENAASARLFRELATLRTDVPLAEDVDALEWRGPRPGEMRILQTELGEELDVPLEELARIRGMRSE
jgi:5'-3' exonuclease